MKLTFILISGFLFHFHSNAQAPASNGKCIRLEQIEIGCVPSTIHVCFVNKNVNSPAQCDYVANYATHWKAMDGPIDWKCASAWVYEPDRDPRTPEGSQFSRTPKKTCPVYENPTCAEVCEGCWNEQISPLVGVSAGCIICTRPKCNDEPEPTMTCPLTNQGKRWVAAYEAKYPKCGTPRRCLDREVDPNGISRPVTKIQVGDCPKEPKETNPIVTPSYCPWIADERTEFGCEPIKPANKYVPPAP